MKTMKMTLVAFLAIISINTFAQKPGIQEKREKLEAQKVAYITTKLSLTPDESATFWPIYNKMEMEKKELMKECHKDFHKKDAPDISTLNDEQLTKMANSEFESQQKMLDLRKKYHQEFVKVITIKKTMMLYRAEKDFRKELLKKLKE